MENEPRSSELQQKVASIVAKHLRRPSNYAVAVGIVTEDKSRSFGFGRLSDNQLAAPDENTVFEIGSITKVFTALLLAEAVRRGEVRLEDPAQKYLPEDVQLRSPRARREMTLEHLATHLSGLPRLPPGFLHRVKDMSNPYASFREEDVFRALSRTRLKRSPGTRFAYSNFGMGLLGHILARVARPSYEELVVERICRPLGMESSRIALSPELQSRLAPGHTRRGKPTPNWDFPTLTGAGALRSSVHNMLLFLQANLAPDRSPMPESLTMCQQQHGRRATGNILKFYAVAALAACLGLIIQRFAPVRPGSSLFLQFFMVPVMFAAWRGGFGAGLVATAVGTAGSYALWKNHSQWADAMAIGVVLSLALGSWSLFPRRTGLGWLIKRRRGRTVLWHNGGTGGYRSFAGLIPEANVGVVVLSNSANMVDKVGWKILDVLAAQEDESPDSRAGKGGGIGKRMLQWRRERLT